MKTTLRLFAVITALAFSLSLLSFFSFAEESDSWIFIDGENITRQTNTAIIYRGVSSTGQTQWGHDIVVDSQGIVTDIIEGGLPEGENLAVSEGGYVISAAGVKVKWFKDNVKKGSRLFYDSYTQKLFVCNQAGVFDPYFTKTASVSELEAGHYLLINPLTSGTPTYTYDIAVDANGTVTARGSNVSADEGGCILSASSASDKAFLLMYAPLGAKCRISEGVATFSYDKSMLKETLLAEIAKSEKKLAEAIAGFYPIDINAVNVVITDAKASANGSLDYKTLCALLSRLENEVNRVCVSELIGELRSAVHTPYETDISAVRETVKKAKSAGLNTLFLKLTNGYGSFIPLPDGNKFAQDDNFKGFDVLKAFITVCEEEDIALGLSIDVYYNEYASIAAPDWLSEPNRSEKGATDKFYSPSNEEFKSYYLDYLTHIVTSYDIKTIMFDSLRFPRFHEETDMGYDYITLQSFSDKYGIPINEVDAIRTELFTSPHWLKWVEYRTSLVTDMAKSISETVRTARPDVNLIAISARDSVDHFYMQDITGWLEAGLFDGVCLALYEGDEAENDIIDELAYDDGYITSKGDIIGSYTDRNAFFFTALESSKLISGDVIVNAIEESRSIGSDGYIFSNLDSFIAQNYHLALNAGIASNGAFSPLSETASAIRSILEASKAKINDYILALGGCDEATAVAALTRINDALLLIENDILTHEQATALESDIAMLFASSLAKQSVLKEYEAITKMALLYKEEVENTPPVDESGDISEESGEQSEPEISEFESTVAPEESLDESITFNESESGISIGNILIYGFVAFSFIAAIFAVIVGIKRKKQRPSDSHMPKAMRKQNEDE